MNNQKKQDVIQSISENKIIAILRGIPEDKIIPLTQALYDGGVRLLEVTFSADGRVPDAVTAETIARINREFGDRMYIGAGTVLTPEQVKLTAKAGGSFIISPNVSAKVIKKTCKLGLVSIPGALTPSEIVTASELGADFVKLFPATNLGPSYIKAIRAPLSNIKLLAVGGIDENNMADYLKVGISGFGIGTNITNKKMIEEGDFEGIRLLAEKYIKGVNA